MTKKKKKEFKFYWEEPEQFAQPKKQAVEEPFEFQFTFPRLRFPEMKKTSVNVAETDREIIVKAELPGFKKEEITLNVTDSMVEISAAKRQEKVEKGEKYYREERKAGALRRAFTLPATIDPDKAEAVLENDVLTIRMPKAKGRKKKRSIDVN